MPGLAVGVSLGTRRLAAVIGADAARRLLETSAVFDADEALACRFLTDIRGEDGWPEAVSQAAAAARALPQSSQRLLLAQTVEDLRAQDLAVLVRSVAEPGLKQRIGAFLAQR
jgi:enoyl-CoA hydratase/carnithine racemase